MIFVLILTIAMISVIVFSCVIVQRMRKEQSITLNEGIWSYQYIHFTSLDSLLAEKAVVHNEQATKNKYVTTIYYYHYSITLY